MAHADPVTPELRMAVIVRDHGCMATMLGAPDACSDRWGYSVTWDNRAALEVDHFEKDYATKGRRAPSTRETLVAACAGHHRGTGRTVQWTTSKVGRSRIRAYVEAREAGASWHDAIAVALPPLTDSLLTGDIPKRLGEAMRRTLAEGRF